MLVPKGGSYISMGSVGKSWGMNEGKKIVATIGIGPILKSFIVTIIIKAKRVK